MTTETFVINFAGGDIATLPQGRFFYVVAASSALNIRAEGQATAVVQFVGMGAGTKYGPVDDSKRWTYLRITSPGAQVVTMIVGDDEVSIANAVSIAGLVQVTSAANTVITTVADTNVTAGTATGGTIATNPARRSIAIGNPSTNLASFRVGEIATATRGAEIQPGQFIVYRNTAALQVFNTGAADQAFWRSEES